MGMFFIFAENQIIINHGVSKSDKMTRVGPL